ncbi:MAG: NAD(P)-dependent oxidoreductase [Candidatus Zixiibacteriota bacterium]|nr:MAG: NAD(P)-dependent oxidoreductase [candidate division Zixibacteria bacterium]
MNTLQKTILVTGGAGYIGSVLVDQLLDRGYLVRVIDSLKFGDRGLRGYVGIPGFEFIKGDITSSDSLAPALNGVDSVVHLAAIVGDPACKKYPEAAVRTNKEGSELLYLMALEQKVRRFIFASTCSNYGKMPDPDGYVDETSPLAPVSLYAELKVDFEQHLLATRHDNMTSVCLRFATAHGMSPRPRFDLTVNEFTRDLVLGKRLEIYGEQFWRPYCHTQDLSRAIIMAMEADNDIVAYQAFNVGSTEENYKKGTLVEIILGELPEMREKVHYVERTEDPRDYRVDFSKIKNNLGFDAKMKVIDGVREYIDAIRNGIIEDPESNQYSNI